MDLFIDGVPINGRSPVDQASISALRNDVSSLQSVVAGKADKATAFLKTDADSLKNQLESDLSKKADASSLQVLDSRVTALENKPSDIVAVTEAQYEQLVKEGKVQQNVIYAVSNS